MSRKILLADDSVTAQNMGKKILADAGYDVVTVSNGSAALKKIQELLPDIAVLDVYMPGHSGLEVCKMLKENPQTVNIPVLLTVGKLEPFKSDEALKAKANAFIVKPFEASELLAVIRKIEDANPKPAAKAESKTKKISPLAKVFAANATADAPDPQAEIEVSGWKNRISMPGKRKAEPEPEEEDVPMGTGFRDIAPIPSETSGLRRDSSFTADAVAEPAPAKKTHSSKSADAETDATVTSAAPAPTESAQAEPPLDITPDEIAAIRAAVEVLSGQGDNAPVLHVAAADVEGVPFKGFAPEPEYPVEMQADPQAFVTKQEVAVTAEKASVSAEPLIDTAPLKETPVAASAQMEAVPELAVVAPVLRWKAEAVEPTTAEASASLEQEMQASASATAADMTAHTHNLAEFAESIITSPVDDEPMLSDVPAEVVAIAEPATLAVAAAASGDGNAVATSEEHGPTSKAFTQSFAAVPALAPVPATASAPSISTGFQDLRPQDSPSANHKSTSAEDRPTQNRPTEHLLTEESSVVAAPTAESSTAPAIDRSAPEDEIDSRTKSQMDAAWSNWHDIRNTIVTPQINQQIAEVSGAEAPEAVAATAKSEGATQESSDIASIVDTMLAEMRPKLLEEIARKLAAKKE